MATTILAADLGKFNSVLCWFEPESRKAEFRTVRSTAAELCVELTRQPVTQVVFEACSQAGWVHDLCEELKPARARRRTPVPQTRSRDTTTATARRPIRT